MGELILRLSALIPSLLMYIAVNAVISAKAQDRLGRLLVLLALVHVFLSLFFLAETPEGELVGLFQAVSKGAPLYIYLAPLAALVSVVLLWRGRPGQYVWVCLLSVVQLVAPLAAGAAWQQRAPQFLFSLGSLLLYVQSGTMMIVSIILSLREQVPLDSRLAFLQYMGFHKVARGMRSMAERYGWHYEMPQAHGVMRARGTWKGRAVHLRTGDQVNTMCIMVGLSLRGFVWPLRVGTSTSYLLAGRRTADSGAQAGYRGEYRDHRRRKRTFTLAPTPGHEVSDAEVQKLLEALESGRRFLRPRAALTARQGRLWYERCSMFEVRESEESLEELLSWMDRVAQVLEVMALPLGPQG
jgi:hypothetical protein